MEDVGQQIEDLANQIDDTVAWAYGGMPRS
jgi:hypothetical protein